MGIGASLMALALVYFTSWYVLKDHIPEWEQEDRGYAEMSGLWNSTFISSAAVGFVAATYAFLRTQSVFATLMFGLVGFYFWFVSVTDLRTMKAPLEVQDVAISFIIPLGLLGILTNSIPKSHLPLFNLSNTADSWIQFGIWFAIVLLLFLFPEGSIGIGDIVILAIVAFAFAPMLGLINLYYLFMASIILQLILFVFANIFNWGVLKPSPFKRLVKITNRTYRAISRKDQDLLSGESRAMPYLPALAAAFLFGGLILL